MVCDPPRSKNTFTYQIWNSFFGEYIRYAPDSLWILETRSDFKVTVTQRWYATLRHPKRHPHTKLGIPTSNNIRDMLRTHFVLKTRSEVKVKITVTQKWYAALHHPKMYPQTKFGTPTLKKIGDKHRTRSGTDGRKDGQTVRLLYAKKRNVT